MCTHEHDTITVPRCGKCTRTLLGDRAALYNVRINGWMCGFCREQARTRLMAKLTRNHINKENQA